RRSTPLLGYDWTPHVPPSRKSSTALLSAGLARRVFFFEGRDFYPPRATCHYEIVWDSVPPGEDEDNGGFWSL
ncbi:MAG: hypothetical protein KC416_05085, partial [Myxococcales bacterium]|nr:hypothetical protein [Myxococcales bacterium]